MKPKKGGDDSVTVRILMTTKQMQRLEKRVTCFSGMGCRFRWKMIKEENIWPFTDGAPASVVVKL